MKVTKWLNEEEAMLLGFEPKNPEKNRTKARYQLSESDIEKLSEIMMMLSGLQIQ